MKVPFALWVMADIFARNAHSRGWSASDTFISWGLHIEKLGGSPVK